MKRAKNRRTAKASHAVMGIEKALLSGRAGAPPLPLDAVVPPIHV